ncbi:hypothetical protein PROTEUSMB838_29810 [Proteus sp. MB838]
MTKRYDNKIGEKPNNNAVNNRKIKSSILLDVLEKGIKSVCMKHKKTARLPLPYQ